jgi:hypothetical protein
MTAHQEVPELGRAALAVPHEDGLAREQRGGHAVVGDHDGRHEEGPQDTHDGAADGEDAEEELEGGFGHELGG